MKTSSQQSDWHRWWLVVIYAIAMAWVESAAVFYLRSMIDRIEPYQPNPLPVIGGFGAVELPREFATFIAGAVRLCRHRLRCLGYFLLRLPENNLRMAALAAQLGHSVSVADAVVGAGALAGFDFAVDDFVGHIRQPV
jgi:hypothetical protein